MIISRKNPEWFRDADFWQDYAPVIFDSRRWKEVPASVDWIINASLMQLEEPEAPKVLDMCSGPGRYSLEFARRGCTVTAVDITKPYLDAGRESARAENLEIEFIEGDAREWTRPESFDLAVNLYNSFGYFSTPEEDEAMLRCLYRSLKPGGILVMELLGKEIAARDFSEGEWFEQDGRLILTEFTVIGDWEAMKNRWVIIEDNRIMDTSWTQRLYSASELKKILHDTGFKTVRVFGSLEGHDYKQDAKNLVILASV